MGGARVVVVVDVVVEVVDDEEELASLTVLSSSASCSLTSPVGTTANLAVLTIGLGGRLGATRVVVNCGRIIGVGVTELAEVLAMELLDASTLFNWIGRKVLLVTVLATDGASCTSTWLGSMDGTTDGLALVTSADDLKRTNSMDLVVPSDSLLSGFAVDASC